MVKTIKRKGIAFIGDLTVDTYLQQDTKEITYTHLGGASLNNAVWALRAGADRVSVIAAVGSDTYGNAYVKKVKAEHVSGDGIQIIQGKTSSIEIFVDPESGEHTWGVWDAGVLERFHLGKKEFDVLQLHKIVSVTVYGKTVHLLSELVEWADGRKDRPMVTLNFNDLSQFGNTVDIVARHSAGFDAAFFGLNTERNRELVTDIQRVAESSGKLMVVTLGKHGAVAFKGEEMFESPAIVVPQDDITDTTGAGDAFLGAFLVTYVQTNGDIPASLASGNHFGAQKILIRGAY